MCECADFESLFSKVAFLYVLKCHVTVCLKCVGARGGVERESESIRDWKIDNSVSINGIKCKTLVGLNKFDRIGGNFFLLL